ncbi:MAG: hypothetical protein ACPGJV_03095 [Bacteriovoracaceae bacterium]
MLDNSLLEQRYFWQFLDFLQRYQIKQVSLEEVKLQLGLNEDQLIRIVSFCHKCDFPISIEKDILGRSFLRVIDYNARVKVDMSFNEWMALQSTMMSASDETKRTNYFQTLDQKIQTVLGETNKHNLYSVIEREKQKQNMFLRINGTSSAELISKLEDAIENSIALYARLEDNRILEIYPLRVVVIEGELSLVAEDCLEKCLVYFQMSEIVEIKPNITGAYEVNFTKVEIEDFIVAMRRVMGTEERLVLKLLHQSKLDLTPSFQHFGRPFITSNQEGEVIWAGSVERSKHLYDWLYQNKEQIVILDPQVIVTEFSDYCAEREKLKHSA